MVVDFRVDQIFMDFVRFLIHELLYAWCLKVYLQCLVCIAIRMLTCFKLNFDLKGL